MLPNTLTPEQMSQIQSRNQPSSSNLPDTLTPEQMNSLQVGGEKDNLVSKAGQFLNQTVLTPALSLLATPAQIGESIAGQPDYVGQGISKLTGVPTAPATPAGFLQKAGQALSLATLAFTPEVGGAKALGLLGAASGAGQSLAQGNTDAGKVLKDTIFGGLFAFGLGTVGNFGNFIKNAEIGKTGVTGYVEKQIANTDPDLLTKYINAAKAHSEDIRVPTPDAIAEKEMENRAQILSTQVIPKAGEAVGAAKKAASKLPITYAPQNGVAVSGSEGVNSLTDDINTRLQEMTGHQFSSYGEGESSSIKISNYKEGASTEGLQPIEGSITKLPGRSVDISPADKKALEKLHANLQLLSEKPTVQTASDVIHNLDAEINWDRPQFGEGSSPVDGVIRYARGAINKTIAPSSPELATANSIYSGLKDLEGAIGTQAGKNLQSASLFMRRVLSGDKSSDVIPTLDQLDRVVGPYLKGDSSNLVQHSILADWAKRTFGDSSTKTLFNQYLTQTATGASSVFGYPRQFMNTAFRDVLGSLAPNPEEYALSVAKGESYSMNPIVRAIDKAIESAQGKPIVGMFAKQLKDLGVTAHNVESAAIQLAKVYLFQKLSAPNNIPLQGNGVPNVTIPGSVQQQQIGPQSAGPSNNRTLSIAAPFQKAINNTGPATSGQQFSSQARQLNDFGMNLKNRGLSLG